MNAMSFRSAYGVVVYLNHNYMSNVCTYVWLTFDSPALRQIRIPSVAAREALASISLQCLLQVIVFSRTFCSALSQPEK